MLEKLMPKVNTEFKLKEIRLKKYYEFISEMKSSNLFGFDWLSSKIIKEIPQITSMFMTHAILPGFMLATSWLLSEGGSSVAMTGVSFNTSYLLWFL